MLETRAGAISGSTVDPGHHAVAALTSGYTPCSATLIGHRTVLTAGHCIDQWGFGSIRMDDGAGNAVRYRYRGFTIHPEYRPKALIGFVDTRYDLAIVQLEEAPDFPHATVSSTPPAVGESVDLVGYGPSGPEDLEVDLINGRVRRHGTATVRSVDQWRLTFGAGPSNICKGDSGGATLAEVDGVEMQVGVHAAAANANPCGTLGIDVRLDAHLDWLLDASCGDISIDGAAPGAFDEACGYCGDGVCSAGEVRETCYDDCSASGGDEPADGFAGSDSGESAGVAAGCSVTGRSAGGAFWVLAALWWITARRRRYA